MTILRRSLHGSVNWNINTLICNSNEKTSLPTRERELKFLSYLLVKSNLSSLPTRERELKLHNLVHFLKAVLSLPTRERELKLIDFTEGKMLKKSLPTRERELKSLFHDLQICQHHVAPYTGAWIEIEILKEMAPPPKVAPYTGAWIEILTKC